MGIVYLAVPVVLIAALAAVGYHFYRTLESRIIALASGFPVPESRYVQPADTLDLFPATLPSEDIVGAWAQEQQARGIVVSDEEIEIQRQMWAAEA